MSISNGFRDIQRQM